MSELIKTDLEKKPVGYISKINGPVIVAKDFVGQKIGDLVLLGAKELIMGEILKIIGEESIIQAFDETEGLVLGEPVRNLGYPLSVELGPGLIGNIYDGIQRPLKQMEAKTNSPFISTSKLDTLDREIKWHFIPTKKVGDNVQGGDFIGYVYETINIKHSIMVPINIKGVITEIVGEGDYNVDEIICKLKNEETGKINDLSMHQRWPVRISRPYLKRELSTTPLITGMRVIDLLFPIAKGGTVAVPGGFGTGKTIIQHSLAKFSDADIIVYIGCGERGNEIAEIIENFPKLLDPYSNRPLIERMIIIANTSNMPVSAREASLYCGMGMAEYYRDIGYNVLILADSTSRWAEALRELSARLEELPTEGGFPAYLSSKLSAFYERAGYVSIAGSPSRKGSITVVGAVSPPSADLSEPVTKTTKRFVRAFWALDVKLAYSRHYPAVNWIDSYSLYDNLSGWWENWSSTSELALQIKSLFGFWSRSWKDIRVEFLTLLTEGEKLANYVQLIGKENLAQDQQLILFIVQLIKQNFLIQNAYNEFDAYSSAYKTLIISSMIIYFYDKGQDAIKNGIPVFKIQELDCIQQLNQLRFTIKKDDIKPVSMLKRLIDADFESMKRTSKRQVRRE